MQKLIWVIDDELSILEVLKVLLEEHDYIVECFSDIVEVENHLHSKNKTDLICLDLRLSGVDGTEIARKLNENEKTKDIPLLLMTADIHIDEKAKAMKADDYIQKPFVIKDFITKVDAMIR